VLPAQIVDISEKIRQGSRSIKLNIGGETLLAKVSEYSVQLLELAPGQQVFAQIKSAALMT
jgi:molybdate transport system ATP-binding protein